MDEVPEKKIVSVNITHAVFFLLDFFEVETNIFSWKVGFTTIGCIILKNSADLTWWFGIGDLGLARHGPVQGNPVSHFISEFRMTMHIEMPNLREKPHFKLDKYAMCSHESLIWGKWRTADWHQCHSLVPALWAMWHN